MSSDRPRSPDSGRCRPSRGVERGRRPALRRDRHRHRRGRRHARPPAAPTGQAGPAARTRRLPAARARQLGLHRGLRQRAVPGAGVLVRPARPGVPAGGQLLRRRQHQVLRRRAVPAAPGGLRRAAPPRRHLAGLADRLRRPRAVLHRRPSTSTWCTAGTARTRPRARRARSTAYPPVRARAADPAAERRPGEAGPAPVPPADRRRPRPRTSTGRATHDSVCIRCDRVDGFPCLVGRQVRRPGDLRRPGARARRTSS